MNSLADLVKPMIFYFWLGIIFGGRRLDQILFLDVWGYGKLDGSFLLMMDCLYLVLSFPLSITEADKADIFGFGSFSHFRKRMGSLLLSC